MVCYVGIDNGVSGSIGVLDEMGTVILLMATPTRTELNYTKEKRNISRVDSPTLFSKFKQLKLELDLESPTFRVFIERPMVNPGRFQATVSAVRALEATLIVIERMKWSYQYIDSKEWQKVLLPAGSSKEALKQDSVDIGCRRFPNQAAFIRKHKDADGLLIAEAMRSLRR